MDRRRVRLWARIGLYVTGACMAYVAVWIAWMVSGQVATSRGTIHVIVALVVAFLVATPSGYAFAMAKE